MLIEQKQIPINPNNIKKNLEVDRFSYRWFKYLIFLPAAKTKLNNLKKVGGLYPLSKNILIVQIISGVLSTLFLFLFLFTAKILHLILGLFFIYLFLRFFIKRKKTIIEIINYLVSEDFSRQGFSQKSLYQIAEFYSNEYKIISLIDTTYNLDRIGIMTILTTLFILVVFIPARINLLFKFLTLLISFFVVLYVVNLPFFYKRLK